MAIKQLGQQFAKKIFVDDSAVDGAIASAVSSSNQFSAAYSNLQSNVVNTAMQAGQAASKIYDQKVDESYQKGIEDAAANTPADLLEAEVTAEENEGWFDKLFTTPQEAYAEAYDKSQKAIVQNNISAKLDESMSLYAQNNPTDVAGFREKMDLWKKNPQDLLSELEIEHEFTPETREFAIRSLADSGSKYLPKLISNQIRETKAQEKQSALISLQSTRNTMARRAREGDDVELGKTIADYETQLQTHLQAGSITPAEATQLRYEFNKIQNVEYVQGDVDEAFFEVDSALKGNFTNYPNALATAKERIEGGAAIMSTLKGDEGNYIYSKNEIDAWKNGQYGTLSAFEKIAKDKVTEATSVSKLGNIMKDPNDIVDIKNKDEVKAAESAYNTLRTQTDQQIQMMIDNNQISMADAEKRQQEFDISFVENSGYVPEMIRSDIRTGLASNDPERVATSTTRLMQFMDSNAAVNNYVRRQFSDKQIKDAISIQANIDAGMTPEAAVEIQRTAESRDGKAAFEFNTRGMASQDWTEDEDKIVNEFVDSKQSTFSFLTDEEDPTDAIQAQIRMDTKQLYKQYLADPNITSREAAQKKVQQELNNRYQVTTANSVTEVTRYSMETTYGAWAAEQAKYFRHKAAGKLNIPMQNIRLEAEPRTGAKGKPSYFVLIEQDDGDLKQLKDENGRPRIFTPNKALYEQQRDAEDQRTREQQEVARQTGIESVSNSGAADAYIQRAKNAIAVGVEEYEKESTNPWVLRVQNMKR